MNYNRISLDYPDSVRWQHLLVPLTDSVQKLTNWPDYHLGKVPQPSESRLSDVRTEPETWTAKHNMAANSRGGAERKESQLGHHTANSRRQN